MANKAISELPQALNVNNQDLFVLEQSGITKKLTAETFITEQGIIDALAEALDGHGGISSVTLSSVSGRIRTYLITFTDETTTTFQVYDGTSIDRIEKTSTAGLVDTYTIFMSDGTTSFFQVTNGNYGLDRTLTMSNAAAPADLVGEISKKIWVDKDDSFLPGSIKTNVTIGDTVDITRSTSTQIVSAVIPCMQGDKFLLTGTGGNNPRVWAFCDTGYHLLSKSTNDLHVSDLELTASADGYFIANVYIAQGYSLKMSQLVAVIQPSYAGILDNFAQSVGEVATVGGNWSSDIIPDHGQIAEWINKISLFETGSIITNVAIGNVVNTTRNASNTFDSAIAPCKVGDVFKVSGSGGNNPRLWAFCDSDYKLISKSTNDLTADNLVLIAPSNGYLICNIEKNSKALYFGFYASISAFNPTLAELYSLYDSLVSDYPNYITKTDLGLDQSGEYHLYKYSFVPESITVTGSEVFSIPSMPKILLGSGTHGNGQDAGDEPEMVVGIYYLFKNICDNWYGNETLTYLRHHVHIELIPVQNPWGYVNKSRRNSRQVDINRNFPFGWNESTPGTNDYGGPEPLSEAESVIIKNFIDSNTDALFYFDLHTTGGTQEQDKMIYYSMSPNNNLIVPANDTVIYLSDKWNHESISNLDTTIMHGYIHSGGASGSGEIYQYVNGVKNIPACIMEAFPNFEDSGLSKNSDLVMRMCQEELVTFIIKCIRYFKFNYLSNQR